MSEELFLEDVPLSLEQQPQSLQLLPVLPLPLPLTTTRSVQWRLQLGLLNAATATNDGHEYISVSIAQQRLHYQQLCVEHPYPAAEPPVEVVATVTPNDGESESGKAAITAAATAQQQQKQQKQQQLLDPLSAMLLEQGKIIFLGLTLYFLGLTLEFGIC